MSCFSFENELLSFLNFRNCYGFKHKCYFSLKSCFFILVRIFLKRIRFFSSLKKLTSKDPSGKYLCVSLFDNFNYRGHICLSFPVLGQSTFDFQKDNSYRPYAFEHVRHMTYQVCLEL